MGGVRPVGKILKKSCSISSTVMNRFLTGKKSALFISEGGGGGGGGAGVGGIDALTNSSSRTVYVTRQFISPLDFLPPIRLAPLII